MIRSRQDYLEFTRVERDLGGASLKNKLFPSPAGQFIRALRVLEYHYNSHHRIRTFFAYWRWWRLVKSTGISIAKNVCEKGLTIPHHGSIVVNAACHIGENCMIQNNVNIGANGGSMKAPQIGRDVYIGPGAVIYGDITIADGCYIGANAVVNKSFLEPNSVIVGVPAKVIKYESVHWWEKNGLSR